MESNNPLLSNDTSMHDDERWWVPLAIALPVCLFGIVLITVLVIVVIVCYRSKFKYKIKKTDSDGKLNSERASQIESTDAVVSGSTYANLDQTVQETKKRATNADPEPRSNSNVGTNFVKALWDKTTWRTKNSTDLAFSGPDRSSEKTEDEIRIIVDEKKTVDETDLKNQISLVGLNGRASKHPGSDVTSKTTPENKPLNGHVVLRRNKQKQQPEDIDNDETKPLDKSSHHSETRKTFVVMYPMESGDVSKLPLKVNDVIFYLDEEKDGWMKGEKKQSGEVGWFPRNHVREGMSPLAKRHSMPKMSFDSELAEANQGTLVQTNGPDHWSRPVDIVTTETTTPVVAATTTTGAATTKTDHQIIYNDDDDDFDDVDDDDDSDDYETGIEYQALYPYRALEDGDINFDAGDVIVVVERLENGWWRGYSGDEQGFFPGSYVQLKSSETINPTDDNANFKDGELPSTVEDLSRSVAELLPISVVGEEAEDDEDEDGSTTNKKNKNKNVRKSLGLFFKSIPRKINAGKAGVGAATDQSASTAADRAKKGEKSAIPWVKKKKQPNLPPRARRCSVAPAPPSNGEKTGNALSSIAQMAAKTAQRRVDVLEVTYEDLGTSAVRDRDHESGTDVSGPSLVESIDRELAAGYGSGQLYANLTGDDWTKLNETNQTSTVPISTGVLSSEHLLRPVPPQKPSYSGSTPSIPALFSSREDATVPWKPTTKPKVMAKPQNVSSEDAQERRSIRQPEASTKPKPLTAKPNHIAPGFPDFPGSMRREQCRSLDSVLLGAETAAEEDEVEDGELEIVRWLQRKLSAEKENVGEVQRKSPMLTHQLQHKMNGVNETRRSNDKERMAHLLEDIFKRGPKNEESFA